MPHVGLGSIVCGRAKKKNSQSMAQRGRIKKIEYTMCTTAASSLLLLIRENVTDTFLK